MDTNASVLSSVDLNSPSARSISASRLVSSSFGYSPTWFNPPSPPVPGWLMLASSDNVDGTAKGLCDVVSVTLVAPDLTLNADDSTTVDD